MSPGPRVTAIPSMSFSSAPASQSAWRITDTMASVCLREAISGTTPPYLP